jgi:hypothetical protein
VRACVARVKKSVLFICPQWVHVYNQQVWPIKHSICYGCIATLIWLLLVIWSIINLYFDRFAVVMSHSDAWHLVTGRVHNFLAQYVG